MAKKLKTKPPMNNYAVFSQRVEGKGFDDFPTPPWAIRAFMDQLVSVAPTMNRASVWEPGSNRGYMPAVLTEYFAKVLASDITDYGMKYPKIDFTKPIEPKTRPSWVITNPPFIKLTEFMEQGLTVAQEGVALLTRLSALEGQARYEKFSERPPTFIMPYVNRVPMHKGKIFVEKGTTATAYCWLVWSHALPYANQVVHIPGHQKDYVKPGDIDINKRLAPLVTDYV